MDGKIATLAGAAALAAAPAVGGATPQASENPVPVAASYAELLTPIPNATHRLRAADAQEMAAEPQLIPAQYYHHHHHHHHHHNHYTRWWYMQHGYYWYGGRWVLRPARRYYRQRYYHHHHHHHHHHHGYY